jgi:hypothetical protein
MGVDLDEEGVDDELLQVNEEAGRVRAIVKEFVPRGPGINARSIRKILRDIQTLNKLGIYVGDVRTDNFSAGKLVDFGLSSTEPHCILESFGQVGLRDSRLKDLAMFKEMVEKEGLDLTPVRAMPNAEDGLKLRSWATRYKARSCNMRAKQVT